jgi:tetratricopeptide (TPR) repeat protein
MGAFFESIHVRSENADDFQLTLRQIAKETDCKILMGPAFNGWISVFPSESLEHDRISVEIAKHLPNDIFHLNVHDDDIFSYAFYREGRLIDQYNSCPDYFEEVSDQEKKACQGRPELFQDLLEQPNSLSNLKTLLTADKYIFESERAAQFAKLLGLSNALASYDYLQAEDMDEDEIEGWKLFIHIVHQPESAEDYNDQGKAKLSKGDLDGALADFNKSIEMKPGLAEAFNNRDLVEQAKNERNEKIAESFDNLGNAKLDEGDLDTALNIFNQAIEFKPDLASAFNGRGRIKRAKKDFDGAMADFNRAIELESNFANAYNNRGLVKVATNDSNGAMSDYNRALELQPDLVVAYNNRGELKRCKSDWDGALSDYNRAIELQPDLVTAYNNRGEVKRAKGDFEGALIDFNKAVELKPDSGIIYNNRAELKRAKGDLDGAMADYNKALELLPNLASAYSNRGLLKQAKGNLKEALTDFDRAIELNPRLSIAYNNRARAKHAKGDFDGALSDYNQAIELNPKQFQFHGNRGDSKRAKGDLDGAMVDFNRAIELQPNWADAFNCRGEVRRAKGDFNGALIDYNRAIELNPNLAGAFNNRGLAKKAMGDLNGALADCDQAVKFVPDSAQAISNRGLVKRAKGDLDGALADFSRAIELKPTFGAAIENRDEVRKAKRKLDGAKVPNQNKIPATENTLALRTDFSEDTAWEALCAAIQNPDAEFTANVDFVNDPKFDGLKANQLLSLLPDDSSLSFAFIIDHAALTLPDNPILVVDLQDEPGRTFRVICSALWEVENNLSIANMDFNDFFNAVDKKGVYRGI